MKKVLLIAAVSSFVLSSCKKDWTCACSVVGNGTTTEYTTTVKDKTKKEAIDDCEYTYPFGSYTTTCVLVQ